MSAAAIEVIQQDGVYGPVTQGKGIGIRTHDDVMLSWGYSRTAHIDFELAAGEFAVMVLQIPAGLNHHVEGRAVEAYNSSVDVKVIPNWVGALPAVVSTLNAFNQKGGVLDPDVKSILTFRGTDIASDPILPTLDQIIDHATLRAITGQGSRASSKDAFASVVGRYYYEGYHVVLFENVGDGAAEIKYQLNWHEFA